MKIIATLREIFDAPCIDSWEYICNKYGLSVWCLAEGLARDTDTLEITFEDAKKIGLIDV